MLLEEVLRYVEQANAEEAEIIMKAAIRRREGFLDGGEIVWTEYSRERVEHLKGLIKRAMQEAAEEGQEIWD